MLQCGLDGIKRQLPLPPASEEDLFESVEARSKLKTLPGSLAEAIEELDSDEIVKQALGPHIYQRYRAAKLAEWDDYRLEVTQWELARYLPTL